MTTTARAGSVWLAIAMAPAFAQAHADSGGFDCIIEPTQVIEVRSAVSGIIDSVLVHRGDHVRKGQLLVTLDAQVERSSADAARLKSQAIGELQVAEAKLAAATIKVNRNQSLYQENFVSAQARDDAEADRRTAAAEVQQARENAAIAQAQYQQAEEELKRRELRSTLDGVVMEQNLYPGSAVDGVEGKKPILKLADISALRAETRLPLGLYEHVKTGSVATIKPEAPLKGQYSGVVKVIDRVVDMASGTFGVVAEFKNPTLSIPSGVRCTMSFEGSD